MNTRAAVSTGSLALVFLSAFLPAGCRRGPGPSGADGEPRWAADEHEPRDVLLVTVDTLRHDATGFSGSGNVQTPTWDKLAAGGLVFRFAHAHAVVTLPSHASILTGLYPYEHGIRDNAGFKLAPSTLTLATLLKGRGYETAAFVSALPLDRRFGLDLGFDVYDDEYEGHRVSQFTLPERPGSETVARARAWWDAHRGSRRFMWVHLFTPHYPYEPAAPHASRYRAAPYYGDVAMADAELAPLLGPLLRGEDRRAVVVFTSDHGEALGDHGEQTHGTFAYEAVLRVPLVLWAPGLVTPGVTERPARHVDLLPSVLGLVGADLPEGAGLAGRSLGAASEEDTGSYFEALTAYLNCGWAPLTGRIEGRRKAIRLPIPELYDLGQDPGEERNLAGASPELLEAALAALPEEAGEPVVRGPVDAEHARKLASLGYLAASGPVPTPESFDESHDPKRLVHLERALFDALGSYRDGRVEEAIRGLRDLIARQPRMSMAYAHLAFIYTDLGRLRTSVETLSRAMSLGVGTESIRRMLALDLMRLGEPERAWGILEGDRGSEDPETQSGLGRIAAALGRPEVARAHLGRALDLDPTFPGALVDLGTLEMTEGRPDEARMLLERALGQDPFLAEGWNALGVLRSRADDVDGAVGAWRRAVEVDSRMPDAWFNLALGLRATGRLEEAVGALEHYLPLVESDERRRAEGLMMELRRQMGRGTEEVGQP
jgi:arylsulfatase A-like enzyme/Flp pilus assembly protein TadD